MSDSPPIFCNAGPAIALGKLNRLDLLAAIYPEVQMPEPVYHEVVLQGIVRGESDARVVRAFWRRQGWPVVPVLDEQWRSVQPAVALGRGELAVLTLAAQYVGAEALLDDALARTEARRLGIKVRGTVGVLVQAYTGQYLSLSDLEFLFDEIIERPDIWISEQLCRQVLQQVKMHT